MPVKKPNAPMTRQTNPAGSAAGFFPPMAARGRMTNGAIIQAMMKGSTARNVMRPGRWSEASPIGRDAPAGVAGRDTFPDIVGVRQRLQSTDPDGSAVPHFGQNMSHLNS